MSEIEFISNRASVKKEGEDLSLVISSAPDKSKAKSIGIILGLWLAGGIYIGLNYFKLQDENAKLMIVIWIAFWLYFSYVIGKAFRWQYFGRELIQIRKGKLFYKRDVGGRGIVKEYQLNGIANLKKYDDKSPAWTKKFGADYWSVDCDSLSFEYEETEIAFGFRLSEKESDKIQKLLRQYLPNRKK